MSKIFIALKGYAPPPKKKQQQKKKKQGQQQLFINYVRVHVVS